MRYFYASLILALIIGLANTVVPSKLGGNTPKEIDPLATEKVGLIEAELIGKTTMEKANIKGDALSLLGKQQTETVTFADVTYTIEITDTQKVPDGVAVFARVWDEKGNQIGFGVDGTVDIERFIIINPPIMVDDPNGKITRTITPAIDATATTTAQPAVVRTLTENPKLALLQTLVHTIKVKGEKFGPEKIIAGKVGHTTGTFFPSAGAASPVDGYVGTGGVTDHVTWGAAHDATGEDSGASASVLIIVTDKLGGVGTNYRAYRSITLFDTSTLTAGATISAATYSIWMTQKNDNQSDSVGIVQTAPASNSALANSDYSAAFTVHSDTVTASATLASMSLAAYNDFTLDATGRGWISKTGITKLGIRYRKDYIDTASHTSTPTSGQSDTRFSAADTAGTSQDPKLVVTYSTASFSPWQLFPF